MATLISCSQLEKSFGGPPLFKGINLTVTDGEKIGVLGPNGSGKSTLMRVIADLEAVDSGTIIRKNGLRMAYLSQQEDFTPEQTVLSVLHAALETDHCSEEEGWARIGGIQNILGIDDLDQTIGTLSGGWRKRVALAAQIVRRPDLLILDEPTNHLDIEGISWLEKFIMDSELAIVIVSHDRTLLENVTSRIFEINRIYPQGCYTTEGNYSKFLERREEYLQGIARYEDSLRNKVRREIEWLRRGARARTTKAQGRINSANRMIGELKEFESRSAGRGTVDIDFSASGRKTKILIEAKDLQIGFNGRMLFDRVNLTLSPGTRLGLVGANGTGKSTLLKILEGEVAPDQGTLLRAPDLRVVIFDQNREQLDPNIPLRRAIAPDSDSVVYRDRSIHVASWASRFLFRSDQLQSPVRSLSGGEQARLLIAKLMLRPADVLFLDEPTNDLDIETLQVLEESLDEFPGAIVLVTHDRFMLDRVSTSILGLGVGEEPQFFASYSQWEAYQEQIAEVAECSETGIAESIHQPEQNLPRLSQQERKELGSIQRKIDKLEFETARLKTELSQPEIIADLTRLNQKISELQIKERDLERLIEKWGELESRS